MARLFGTDGVRGLANGPVITAPFALHLAMAAAQVLGRPTNPGRAQVVVGRDPRASGEFLSAAVIAGLAASGVDVLDVGVLPTPAVAFLTADTDAAFGVMLSASHNAMPDNGIKFFAAGGHKLPDATEDAIQHHLERADFHQPAGAAVGRVRGLEDAADRYMKHLLGALPHRLDGLHVVLDAAHGAASAISPEVFRRAGAQVEVIGAAPDGLNINDQCGSTYLEGLQQRVVASGADLGIAHDGDADRCLAVDARGCDIDGDQIMAVLALAFQEQDILAKSTLVATVMSNLGLLQAMQRAGIAVRQAGVGDRYVLEEMRSGGFNLGGEQSGHLICLDHSTTGDGILTGLLLASRMAESGLPLQKLTDVMERLPQVLINVADVDKDAVDSDQLLQVEVAEQAALLGQEGRILLRKSGTEPLVRVMVEAADAQVAQRTAEHIAQVVRERLRLATRSLN